MRISVIAILGWLSTVGVGPAAEVYFEKQVISERFVAEGCDVADLDQDGHADIAAGNSIWHGP